MSIFDDILGSIKKSSVPDVDPAIAADVWVSKTPIVQKLPEDGDKVITIKAGSIKQIMRQAYEAGFARAKAK